MLEISIGGYEFPDRGGGSLRMRADLFPSAKIVGVDLFDKSGLNIPANVTICQAEQSRGEQLQELHQQYGQTVLQAGFYQFVIWRSHYFQCQILYSRKQKLVFVFFASGTSVSSIASI